MRTHEDLTPAEVYDQYLAPAIADPFTRILLECAAPRIGERVLDVACGTGSVARHVAPLIGSDGNVVALDINRDMLAVARARPATAGATIEWREGNAMALPLGDSAFDLVLCQQGLQFVPDRAASVREMRRVLRSGGRVALSVWQNLDLHPVYAALFEATTQRLGAAISEVSVPFSLGRAEEVHRLLDEAGFEKIEVTSASLDVHMPTPRRFVALTVLGAATSVPAFARLDSATRTRLVEEVAGATEAVLQRYHDGNKLTFPMYTNIAIAAAR